MNKRIEQINRILSLLKTKWNTYPSFRLMQLIDNLIKEGEDDGYTLTDEELEKRLKEYT